MAQSGTYSISKDLCPEIYIVPNQTRIVYETKPYLAFIPSSITVQIETPTSFEDIALEELIQAWLEANHPTT